jgi:glycosyltransferase involved in cell wall biosynthesis
VERELARRAASQIKGAVDYCIYVRSQNRFRKLKPAAALDIIEGRLTVDFDQEFRAAPPPPPVATARRRIRDMILESPRLYQQVQRLRGISFTLEQIAEIKAHEAREQVEAEPPPKAPLSEVCLEDVFLTPNVTIISGGLDWEHKDVRALYKLKRDTGFRYVSIVYDIIPLLMPHFLVPGYVELLNDYFGELLWLSDGCMCISQATQRDLLDHCRRLGIDPPATRHFPLGCDLPEPVETLASVPRVLAGKRYAIFVSTLEPRKNHRAAYQAWQHAIQTGQIDPETCRLVFVGRPGWNINDLMHEIGTNPLTRDTIVVTGSVDDATLRALYQGADFGIFPSFYEGYGLPVAELLGYGKPCISSTAGSLREVGQSFVVYRDPLDVLGWAEAMAAFFNDPVLLKEHRDRIREKFTPVTWDVASRKFFDQLPKLVA